MKKWLILATVLLSFFQLAIVALNTAPVPRPAPVYDSTVRGVAPMPVVRDDPYVLLARGGTPVEQRDEQYRKWLAASVKISVSNASGSGTIVYVDPRDGYAYVQSCGHLWSGVASAAALKARPVRCSVVVWYHNGRKLDAPRTYPADVLYYSHARGRDCSLLRFKPDWDADYVPVAPADFRYDAGMRLHSCGCDHGKEVAHYEVRYLGDDGGDVTTTENSPRPGRSGGGLMTDDYFVGVCWGTTNVAGTGNGKFTPLAVVRSLNEQNGFGWLNEAGFSWARRIPIVDRNNAQQRHPRDYIPLPQGH